MNYPSRKQYGLKQNTGREIHDYYKKTYDASISAVAGVGGNGLHYMLSRLADPSAIGWGPFKKTFRELNSAGGSPWGNTNYAKFRYLLSLLSKYASEDAGADIDVETKYFTQTELESIQKALK